MEGDTSDWAVPVSHSSGQTVMLIGNQMLVLVWKLRPVAVAAEMALHGVGAAVGLQVGLVLDGEFVQVHDFPKEGGLLQWHIEFSVNEFVGGVRAQLYVSGPDGPVGRMTRPLELRVRQMRISEYAEVLEKLKAEEGGQGGAREGNVSSSPDTHLLDENGGGYLPEPGDLNTTRREKARVCSPWDTPGDVVALRRVLDDVNLQVLRLNL